MRFWLVSITTLIAVASCASPDEPASSELEGVIEEPIHAVSTTDTSYRAVGYLRNKARGNAFCTATLIGPRTVLAAAHCFTAYANGCTSKGSAMSQNEFVVSVNGTSSDAVAYDFDDLSAAPDSYEPRVQDCPTGSLYGCRAYHFVNKGNDLLLLHLTTSVPSTQVKPMRVITSLEDNSSRTYGVHATLDASTSRFQSRSTIPAPIVVGWGAADTTALLRRSGPAQFESVGSMWHKGCGQIFSCESANPSPQGCSYGRMDGTTAEWFAKDGSFYMGDIIRVARAKIRTDWDGPSPGPGDSGGPLIVPMTLSADGGLPKNYILGTLSVGDKTPAGSTVPAGRYTSAEYSAAFTPENGKWIETTLAYWDSPEFQYRNRGWQRGFENLGGGLSTAPGASSQGNRTADVFVRGNDNFVWTNKDDGTRTEWSRVDTTPVTTAPVSASWGPGRIDLVAADSSRRVIHTVPTFGSFSWEDLGGTLMPGSVPAVSTPGVDMLNVFVMGTDSRLYHKKYDPTLGWLPSQLGWDLFDNGAVASSPASISWSKDRIDVFVMLSDNTLGHKWWANNSFGWLPKGAWERLGGNVGSGPVVASWVPGRLDVFYRPPGSTLQIRQRTRTDAGWTVEVTLPFTGGVIGGRLAATASAPGRIELYAQGPAPASNLLHSWFPSD